MPQRWASKGLRWTIGLAKMVQAAVDAARYPFDCLPPAGNTGLAENVSVSADCVWP
ncbi:MAG: hypothetical protein AMXMBFR84_35520 [Candidatus Hydrogenedentota bacterium]